MVRPVKLARMQTAELLVAYEKAAKEHGRAPGGIRVRNCMADTVAGVYSELRKRGAEAQRLLLVLLNSRDPSVRSWAEAHAMDLHSARVSQS
jgi:hypothetical protein